MDSTNQKPPISRRSFGQAFAKLFNRPNASSGSNSVPPSPTVRRNFDFGPAEYRPTTSSTIIRHHRDASNLSQQAEVAEEADEGCSSTVGSSTTKKNAGGNSSSGTIRPSLSEPRLSAATTTDDTGVQIRLQEDEIRQLMAALTELRRQNVNQRQEFTSKEQQLTSRLQGIQRDNETLRSSLIASKRTADELLVENRRLTKELGSFVQRLLDKEAAYGQLQEQCSHELPSAKQSIHQLNKELFHMGEVNRRLRERLKASRLRQDAFDALRERLRNCEETTKSECGNYRKLARHERVKADAAAQRAQELETLLQKRQLQIAESKRLLDEAGDVHQEQLDAYEMKYRSLMTACQRQEAHILELYEKLEAVEVGRDRRKSGIHSTPAVDGLSTETNGQNVHDRTDGAAVIGAGVDIPDRAGVSSELRSYGSYHSVNVMSHHNVPLSTSVASAGSCQSSDLYLPYLFNLEYPAVRQQRDQECQVDGEENEDFESHSDVI